MVLGEQRCGCALPEVAEASKEGCRLFDSGRYVVFVSTDPNLVAGDTNGVADVFLRDTCRGAGAQCAPSTKRVSVTNVGGQANGASGEAVFTGRYVAFSSLASNLVPGDTNGLQDVFIRDTCLGDPGCVATSTQLVSVGHLGDPADGASSAGDSCRLSGRSPRQRAGPSHGPQPILTHRARREPRRPSTLPSVKADCRAAAAGQPLCCVKPRPWSAT